MIELRVVKITKGKKIDLVIYTSIKTECEILLALEELHIEK